MATENADLALPIFGVTPPGSNTIPSAPLDPWTKITFSFSATDQKTHMDQSSWGFSAAASVSFGLFSAGGSYSHDESSTCVDSNLQSSKDKSRLIRVLATSEAQCQSAVSV